MTIPTLGPSEEPNWLDFLAITEPWRWCPECGSELWVDHNGDHAFCERCRSEPYAGVDITAWRQRIWGAAR